MSLQLSSSLPWQLDMIQNQQLHSLVQTRAFSYLCFQSSHRYRQIKNI